MRPLVPPAHNRPARRRARAQRHRRPARLALGHRGAPLIDSGKNRRVRGQRWPEPSAGGSAEPPPVTTDPVCHVYRRDPDAHGQAPSPTQWHNGRRPPHARRFHRLPSNRPGLVLMAAAPGKAGPPGGQRLQLSAGRWPGGGGRDASRMDSQRGRGGCNSPRPDQPAHAPPEVPLRGAEPFSTRRR
jgi:hypothetical protein